MIFLTLLIILIVSLILYIIYVSYFFQLLIHKKRIKSSFINEFKSQVKGNFEKEGYFGVSHRVVSKSEYKQFGHNQKLLFTKCYNIVKFKTKDANWELFFHLVKEGASFSEILTLRVFPKHYRIKSEGNVEKNYSRLNIFTNNRYLTGILEENDSQDYLKWLIRHNGDILLISHNNLHFKVFINSKKISSKRVLDMVKCLNYIKNKIFKKGIIEY